MQLSSHSSERVGAVPDNGVCAFHRRSGDEYLAAYVVVPGLEGGFEGDQDAMVDIAVHELLDERVLSIKHIFRIAIRHGG